MQALEVLGFVNDVEVGKTHSAKSRTETEREEEEEGERTEALRDEENGWLSPLNLSLANYGWFSLQGSSVGSDHLDSPCSFLSC